MSRIMALDVGDKRIGVAVGDSGCWLATPLTTLHRKTLRADIDAIISLAKQEACAELVIGLPRYVDGEENNQCRKVRAFAKALGNAVEFTIHFENESLSTFTAIERLVERGIKTGHNRDLVDMEAAVVILQTFLERQGK